MPHRILVVEDEASLLLTLVANLELEGFEVSEAASGEQAVELLKTQKFDLVLTDIRMPGMNGVELFHRIREREPELPVVLMTGFALEELVRDAVEGGAFTVFPKPFEVEHLVQVLTAAVHKPLVLVVDDEVPVADSTAEALRASGVRARAVFDGASALAAIKEGSIDVCVVDMVMPGLTGAEVVERVRQLDRKIACIAISGHDVPAMFQRAAPHAFALLRKPIPPENLLATIAKARGRKSRP